MLHNITQACNILTSRVSPHRKFNMQHKLIVGLLSNQEKIFSDIRYEVERIFGRVDMISDVMDFSFTDYYQEEFGEGVKKIFFSFEKLVCPARAFHFKLTTGEIEKKFYSGKKRRVNIDPGLVSESKLILLTKKDYCHRIYLDKGIYAEVTLRFQKNTFTPWPWTYNDYKTEGYIVFFNKVRARLREQIIEQDTNKLRGKGSRGLS